MFNPSKPKKQQDPFQYKPRQQKASNAHIGIRLVEAVLVEKSTKSLNLVHLSSIAFSFKSFTSLRVVCNLFRSFARWWIMNCTVDRQSGCAWWRLDLCVPLVFFFTVDLLLLLSFFLQGFLLFFFFFFFLVSFFLWVLSSFSGFSTFFVLYLKSSVKNSRFMFFWTRLLKTRDLCGINMSNSASGKRVFEARDWYGTRVSKTQDASLQFSFKPVLTYYILSLHNVSLQISPRKHLLHLFFLFFLPNIS